jgi:hypothetical protein
MAKSSVENKDKEFKERLKKIDDAWRKLHKINPKKANRIRVELEEIWKEFKRTGKVSNKESE